MHPPVGCPLRPALLRVLAAAAQFQTTETDVLAERLCLAPETVHGYFSQACQTMEVRDRGTAVLVALGRGWVQMPGTAQAAPAAGAK